MLNGVLSQQLMKKNCMFFLNFISVERIAGQRKNVCACVL